MANSAKRTVTRQVKRAAKRNPTAVILVIVALLLGLAAGYLTCTFLTKNDAFSLEGEKAVTYVVGEGGGSVTLPEPGWTLTALGRNASDSVTVDTTLPKTDGGYAVNTSEPGVFTITYSSSHFLFSKYRLIRTITVKAEGGAD